MFQSLKFWIDRRRALQSFSVDRQDSYNPPTYVAEMINIAKKDFDHGNRKKSFELLNKMRVQFPAAFVTTEAALNLLLDFGHHDDTEALLQQGRKKYPDHAALFAIVHARIAQRRGDFDEAIERCRLARNKFPLVMQGYLISATCLDALGRHADAERIIESGIGKIPGEIKLHESYANYAMQRADWPEALKRWEAIRGRFSFEIGPLGSARCLREMGRFDESEKILLNICEQHTTAWPFAELANLATAKGNLEQAAQQWEAVRLQFPTFSVAYTCGAEALRKIGRHAEADELLAAAASRFP